LIMKPLKSIRRDLTAFIALTLCSGAVMAAWPQEGRPVKVLVPWPTGGATDQVARMLAQPLSQALGVPVENKAGAGGVIGTQLFVKEKPDGHAILLATSSSNAAAPHLYSKLGYDPVNDFTPVVSLCEIPNVMVVPAKSPWGNLAELIAATKKDPGKYTYGSSGIGGSQHLAGAQFKTVSAANIRHVPYKGSGPAAQDLMAGHIDMMLDTGSLGSIRGGLLKPLAVASEKRLAALPDVPTFKEVGVPMLASAWYGLMLPADAPAEVVTRLNTEVNKILRSPEINAKLAAMGAVVLGGTSQEFARFSAAEIKRYEGIVRDSGAPKE
jgi:tripartite-type tricarboxylate transporter receptor subunit TctC